MNLLGIDPRRRRPDPRIARLGPGLALRGVTILELIAVIIISLILATMGFSSVLIIRSQAPIDSTTTRLTGALSSARMLAISRNAPYQVSIDLANRNFWIDEIADADASPTVRVTPKVQSPEAIDDSVILEGVFLTGNAAFETGPVVTLAFRPDGSSPSDAYVTFYMRAMDPGIDTSIYTVRLYAPTGQSKIFKKQRLIAAP